mgnify:CR=1 FL=1
MFPGPELVTLHNPSSLITESYRVLRTNILYSSPDNPLKTLVVTSPLPGEGKTTTAGNLAVVMAQGGSQVLLVDLDLRMPSVHRLFGISNSAGLTNLLVEDRSLESVVQKDSVGNLDILTTGPIPPNPAELVGSKKFAMFIEEMKTVYDYIILDSSPCVAYTDSVLAGRISDGVLLVISATIGKMDAAIQAKKNFEKVGAKIIGVVLNGVNKSHLGYSSYYYYYEDDEQGKAVRKKKKRTHGRM